MHSTYTVEQITAAIAATLTKTTDLRDITTVRQMFLSQLRAAR